MEGVSTMEWVSTMEDTESWKQYASEARRKMVAEIENNPNPSEKDLEFVKFVKLTSVGEDKVDNWAVKATHLFELSSITICRPSTLEKLDDVELYGRIHLVDDNDDEYAVFCQERKYAQVFSLADDNLLTISLRESKLNRPHWLPKYFWVKMYLKDRYRDIRIVKGKFKLDFTGKVVFDKEQCADFHTEGYGVVSVHYTILQHGVAAMVDCKIGNNEGKILRGDGHHPRVKGTISAMVDCKVGENDGFSRALFDKECFVPSIFDPPDEQSWTSPWFAVPAYSSLKIGADLDIDGEKFESNFVEFKAWDSGAAPFERIIQGKKWHIVVNVTWNHAFEFLPDTDLPGTDREGEFSEESLYFSDEDEDDKYREFGTNGRTISYGGTSSIQESDIERNVYPEKLVEIFSIIVRHFVDNNDKPDEHHIIKKRKNDKTDGYLLLSGVIQSHDSMGSYDIFNKDKTAPALLQSNGAVSLAHPFHCHWGPQFAMSLDLQDGQGHEISRGSIDWNGDRADPWYGHRVCSVVSGDFGFAAVHYTMFSDAIQANVNVSFKCLGQQPFPCQVYGRIYARYGHYRYFTRYEKENYQSMLFERCKLEESVKLQKNDENLPLSKVVVAVPFRDSLIVIAELRVRVPGLVEEQILRGKATFKPGCDLGEQQIHGTSCTFASLRVCVQWGG